MKSKLLTIIKRLNSMLKALESDINSSDVRISDDKKLSYMHTTLHSYWASLSKNERVENWDKNKVKNLHNSVVKEMIKRDFKHRYLSDLDDTLPSDLKNKTIKIQDDGDRKDDSQ